MNIQTLATDAVFGMTPGALLLTFVVILGLIFLVGFAIRKIG